MSTQRENMVVGEKKVFVEVLVNSDKIILPPLHIKLDLMKQFVKAVNKEGTVLTKYAENFQD